MKKYYNNIHFDISERKIILRIVDSLLIILSLYFFGQIVDYEYFKLSPEKYLWAIVLTVYIQFFGSVFEIYYLPNASFVNKIFKGVVLTSLVSGFAYLLTPLITPSLPESRKEVIAFFLIIFSSLWLWRVFYAFILASKRFEKKIILICKSKDIDLYASEIQKIDFHTKVIGFLSIDNEENVSKHQMFDIDSFQRFLEKNYVSQVVVAKLSSQSTSDYFNMFLELVENKIPIASYEELYEELSQRVLVSKTEKNLLTYLSHRKKYRIILYEYFSRFFDVIFSLTGLVCLFLILPIIYVLNLIGNKGNMFYFQERIGKNGQSFKIMKLRTMIIDAEANGAVFSQKNDSRITPIGKWLRRTRIDEVPQFWNVLKNEMSIIGPRPERPVFVDQITEEIPVYQIRHIVKPGLTGWAQVSYPYGANLEDSLKKLQYDLYYIKNRNIFLDISIYIKTISTILFMRGQ